MSQITTGHHLIRKMFRPRNVIFLGWDCICLCMRFVRIFMRTCARARTFTHVRIRRSSVTVVSRLWVERPRNRGLISGWPERVNVLVP